MEIVKKEIVKNVSQYKYYGFLSYVLRNSDEIRTMLLNRVLTFYDLDYTELSNEQQNNNGRIFDYDLKTFEKNGLISEYELSVIPNCEDLIFFLNIRSKEKKNLDNLELNVHFNFYIVNECKEEVFDRFVIGDTDIKKIVCVNKTNLKTSEINILEFHCTVNLDYIDTIIVNSKFTHFMYLLKHNKPYDENHPTYKLIESLHNDYLNSEQYAMDLEYELNKARKRALDIN